MSEQSTTQQASDSESIDARIQYLCSMPPLVRPHLIRWAACSLAFLSACASSGPHAVPAPIHPSSAGVCQVWLSTLLGPQVIDVHGSVATHQSLFGRRELAFMDASGGIHQRSVLGTNQVGYFHQGLLVMTGLFGSTTMPVGSGVIVVPGMLSPTYYYYAPTCPPWEAALGASALLLLQREQAAAAAAAASNAGQRR